MEGRKEGRRKKKENKDEKRKKKKMKIKSIRTNLWLCLTLRKMSLSKIIEE